MTVETAIPFDNHRGTPLDAIPAFVEAIDGSGAVDYFWAFDELSGWIPRPLWTKQTTPYAQVFDIDSTHDPFVQAAIAASASTRIGVRLTTDAIRARPAELTRTMFSLAGATRGRAVCAIGAGERRQITPFGYKRSEGLARLEDFFELAGRLWDADRPFDFEGRHWHFKNAYIGGDRPAQRPEFWALGGGPKLIEIATRLADGFETSAPSAFATPERFAAQVAQIREEVERHGRDPDAFGIGIWMMSAIHDDPDVLERAMDSPLLAWWAAIFGRLDQSLWRDEGFEPVMPLDWHYATRLAPFDLTPEEIESIVGRVPREMVPKSLFMGSPEQVLADAKAFVDAGATFVGIFDLLPLLHSPEDAPQAMARTLGICSNLKRKATS